jgi:hypothetical protein
MRFQVLWVTFGFDLRARPPPHHAGGGHGGREAAHRGRHACGLADRAGLGLHERQVEAAQRRALRLRGDYFWEENEGERERERERGRERGGGASEIIWRRSEEKRAWREGTKERRARIAFPTLDTRHSTLTLRARALDLIFLVSWVFLICFILFGFGVLIASRPLLCCRRAREKRRHHGFLV